ncbi:MAG: RsmD family RNA methyltransferase, partial [Firmicutes bacterium]|nr:RsmD family RNA methyltransferase [Bacillota bacterium]
IIRENLKTCGFSAPVLQQDALDYLRQGGKFDLIFLDPPYGKNIVPDCLERIEALDLLNGEGIIIAEHEKFDELPERVGSLGIFRSRRYGKTMISIYSHMDEETGE